MSKHLRADWSTIRWAVICWLSLMLAAPAGRGDELPNTRSPENDAAAQQSARRGQPDVVLVTGAAGEARFGEAFTAWARRWNQVAQQAGAAVQWIGPGSDDSVPQRADRSDDAPPATDEPPTDHQRLRERIAGLEHDSAEPLWIVLLGHGTFSQNIAKFNLQGPDLSADELAQWLRPFSRPLVIINAASSSGPFVNVLSGENRVIVTATRSGTEQNYARFGEHLATAIGDPDCDIDHDGEVSILEAFLAASTAVRDFYRSEDRIATEHALLDDNGDALGTPATAFRGTRAIAASQDADRTLDGELAARLSLVPAAERLLLSDEELAQRDALEAGLARLRAEREQMAAEDYRAAVLPLLVRLARLYEAAETRAAAEPP